MCQNERKIKIGDRSVGEGEPVLVIAEAGSNHNGSLDQAKQLIDVASEAGADVVKFQTYVAESLYSRKTPKPEYLRDTTPSGESVWDLIKKIEMPREWQSELAGYCRDKSIIFMSSPFDIPAVDELYDLGVPAFKIASFEIVHLPLLAHVAKKGLPIILSTGMANLSDIEDALGTIYKRGNEDVILLHCAISYPPRLEDLNLRAMDTMRQAFQLPVGFSDHTMGDTAAIAAVARGACVIEKHFTLDRRLPGPDHPFALEPDELKAMVQAIRDTEKSLGSPVKRATEAESEMYRIGRRSIIAGCDIKKGTRITADMLQVKRPGYGIPPKMIDVVVGREAAVDIEGDDIITWDMI